MRAVEAQQACEELGARRPPSFCCRLTAALLWVGVAALALLGVQLGISLETVAQQTPRPSALFDAAREHFTRRPPREHFRRQPLPPPLKPMPFDEGASRHQREFLQALAARPLITDAVATTRHMHQCFTVLPSHLKRSACKAIDEHSLPAALRLFDWHITNFEHIGTDTARSGAQVRSVYCRSGESQLRRCQEHTDRLPRLWPNETRVLVLASSDTPHLSDVKQLVARFLEGGKFSRVLFSAKDIWSKDVRGLAMGLNDYYVALAGHAFVRQVVVGASLAKKRKRVLAAWGAVWKHLSEKISSRREADKWTKGVAFVTRRAYEPQAYWKALGDHRFLLAPSGQSVWSPKAAEALTMLTIPIVQRTKSGSSWDEGVACFGYPMVIVDHWKEITEEKLDHWWAELSPQLYEARTRLLSERWFSNVLGEGPESRSAACKALARDLP